MIAHSGSDPVVFKFEHYRPLARSCIRQEQTSALEIDVLPAQAEISRRFQPVFDAILKNAART